MGGSRGIGLLTEGAQATPLATPLCKISPGASINLCQGWLSGTHTQTHILPIGPIAYIQCVLGHDEDEMLADQLAI